MKVLRRIFLHNIVYKNVFVTIGVSETESQSETDDDDVSTSFFLELSTDANTETVKDATQEPSTNRAGPFAKPLYKGAPADLSVFQCHLLLFQFSIRHSLTSKALQELLLLLTVLLPHTAALPKSVRDLKRFFMDIFPEQRPTVTKYCVNCHRLLKEGELCVDCDVGSSDFVNVPIGPQLKARLESKFIFRCSYHYKEVILH